MASISSRTSTHDPVAKLAAFLKQNKSDLKILTGKSKLSLTTIHLGLLNRCFATTHPSDTSSESSDGELCYDAQSVAYLRDILHRTVALKLLHDSATLQGAVDVSRFHVLTVLEIKRVPMHFLVGLSSLRSHLKVLVCSRCVNSLQMLLTGCGGDKAEEQDWPVLHTLNLSYNYIDALDESLRFLPALKALDLSHNNIRHTRDYFESLPNLTHLNLSFNQLAQVPSLGELVTSHLQTLLLRCNNVESLTGVEYLDQLVTLDLAKNSIFDTSELFSLGYLHNLRKMHFHGNPFTFEGKWRVVVARYLAPEAARTMTFIDDVLLTKAEILVVPKKSMSRPIRPEYHSDNFMASYRSSDRSYDNLDESMDVDAGELKKRSKVKRSTKVRNASISEQSDDHGRRERARKSSGNAGRTSSSVKSMPGTEAKNEFEVMRRMHGTGWLLALQNPYENLSKPSPSINKTPEELIAVNSTADAPSKLKGVDAPNSVHQEQTTVTVDIHADSKVSLPNADVGVEEVERKSPDPIIAGDDITVNGQAEDQPSSQDQPLRGQQSLDQFDLLMRQESNLQIRMRDGDVNDDEPETFEDDTDLCEPFLIRLAETDPLVQLFVTVKKGFIEERNVHGKVVHRLETRSLKTMSVVIERMKDEFSKAEVELPVVKLSFDYINKDRRRRDYVMEDFSSCQILIQVLEPFFVANAASASMSRIFMQCLKCMLDFPRDDAKMRVEKKPKKSNTWTSEDESSSDFESVNEVLTCPSCGSTLLVELDDPRRSEANTPLGSVASIDLSSKPMASSSPWKQIDQNPVIITSPCQPSQSSYSDVFSQHSAEASQTKSKSNSSSAPSPHQDRKKLNENLLKVAVNGFEDAKDLPSSPVKENSLTASSSSSQLSGTSSDFRLPDPTIKMEGSMHTPAEELANYPQEKLKELLTTNRYGFKQRHDKDLSSTNSARYSLCPADGGSMSSREASGPTTPVHLPASIPFDTHSTNSKAERSPVHRINGPHKLVVGNGINNSRTKALMADQENEPLLPSNQYSEDDIVVLDSSEAQCQQNVDLGNVYHLRGVQSEKDVTSATSMTYGRLGSNESDIAVISETDQTSCSTTLTLPRNSSTGSFDNVFESGHRGAMNQQTRERTGRASDDHHTFFSSNDHHDFLDSNDHGRVYKSGSNSSADVTEDSPLYPSGVKRPTETSSIHAPSPSQSTNSLLSTSLSERSVLAMTEEDCCHVHHRLKLYLSMSIFGDDEDFTCLLKGTICQFSKKQSFEGLVVVSTRNIYLLKITKGESESPSDWLAKRTQHPIKDLARIHLGLGSQSIQLEFSSEGILYTIVTGDKKRTRQFVNAVADAISLGKWKKKFNGIVWEHPQTFLNLTSEVFIPQATGDTGYEVDPEIAVYIASQLETTTQMKQGTSMKVNQVGIIVTMTDVYLVEENHFYPLALGKNKKALRGQQQFSPSGHRKISDISGLELYEDSASDVTVTFFSEDTGEECKWNISTASPASLDQLLTAIKQPWKEMFGVNIQETIHPLMHALP